MGLLLLFMNPIQTPGTGLLSGLLVLAGFSRVIVSSRRRHKGQPNNNWFVLASIRDILFGLTLLTMMDVSLKSLVNSLGLWALIYAFVQAVETMFYFLGTPASATKGYWVGVIHFICVLLAGGFAFMLMLGPQERQTALRFGSLFLIGLGIVQGLLTHQLRTGTT
ncbi:hypothetical protein GCM10028808_56950 [Spirosoma migulaei]